MAIAYTQKTAIMDTLTSHVAPQKSVLFLTTAQADEHLNSESNFRFRREVREHGVVIKVIKNTLLAKAFENLPDLTGPTYVAFLENKEESDEITVPKAVVTLINEEFKENFSVIGALVNGEFYDAKKTELLSKTPSKEESIARVAGSLNALISKIAIGVKEIPASVARGISAYSDTLK